ncbi:MULTISPECIES: hypothetical protein [Nocardioides]|uniref:Pentapeptide repeat-containing protein n=1 Tax=Nocardioides vastitatis TaxID=2568655 RepID=A0ABW0ZM09_9ACTN|nr:hypothetical protein [Nocardioides sp.]THJ03798.1 hypothetical protein E7Z54_09445 [Nocardioides sp.]
MSSTPRRRFAGSISPLALALLALAIIFGTTGGAVAGAMITGAQVKNGSLTGRDIATGSLKGVDIGNSSVSGADVANGSISGADVKDGSITGTDIADETRMWGVVESAARKIAAQGVYSVAEKSFATPKGYLQITASIDANDDNGVAGTGALIFAPAIDGNLIDAPHYLEFYGEGRGATGSVTVVVPVAAGSHKVELVVFEDGTGSVAYSRELSIVYASAGTSNAGIVTGRRLPARIANR